MIKFILLFIFIPTILLSQNTYYWNDVEIPIHQLFFKMGVPDGIEYQVEMGTYWFAYDFGEAAVIYIVDKGFVSAVLYVKNNKNYTEVKETFLEIKSIATILNGFSAVSVGENHFEANRGDIQITGNIRNANGEYVLAILTIRIKKEVTE